MKKSWSSFVPTRSLFVFLGLFVLFGAVIANVPSAHAATCVYADTGDHDFNSAANWDCGHVPTAITSDTVTINAGDTANLTADAQFTSIADLSGTLNMGVYNIEVDADTIVNSGGSLNLNSGNITSTGSLIVNSIGTLNLGSGRLSLGGDLNLHASVLTRGTGTLRFIGGGTQTVTPSTHAIAANTFFNNVESLKSGGSVTFVGSSADFLGYFTASSTAPTSILFGSTDMTVTGNSSFNSNTTLSSTNGDLRFLGGVTSTGALETTSGDVYFGDDFYNVGLFQVGSGTTTSTKNFRNAPLSTVDAGSGTLVLLQNFVNGGSFIPGTSTVKYRGFMLGNDRTLPSVIFYNLNIETPDILGFYHWASTSTVLGNLTVNTGSDFTNLTGDCNLTIVGDLNNAGIFNMTSSYVTTTGNFTNTGIFYGGSRIFALHGNLSNSGTFSPQTGTFKLFGSSPQTIAGVVFHNYTIDKFANVSPSASTTVTGDFNMIGGSCLMDLLFSDFTVVGTTYIGAGNGIGALSATQTYGGNVTLQGGAINSSFGNTNFLSNVFTDNGGLTVGGGTMTLNGNASSTNLSSLSLGAGTLLVYGDLDLDNSTVLHGTGSIRFMGGANQDFRPSTNFMDFAFNNLESGKTGGTVTVRNSSNTTTFLGYFTSSSTAPSTFDFGTVDVTFGGNASINNFSTVTSTSGDIHVGGVVSSTGSIGSSSGDMFFAGFQNNGTLDIGSGTATSTGNMTSAATGVLNLRTGMLSVEGNFSNAGLLNPGTGTFRVYDGAGIPQTIDPGSSSFYHLTIQKLAGATANFTSSSTVLGNLTVGGISAAGTHFGANDLTVVGLTTINAGTVTSTSGTMYFTGNVSSTGAIGSDSGNMRFDGTVQNNKTLTLGSGITTSTGAVTNAASGTINANTAEFVLGGSFTNAGTFNKGSSTVKYVSNSASNVGAAEYYGLKFLGSATYSLSASTTASNRLTLRSAATLAIGGNTFNVPGDIDNSGLMTTTTGGTVVHPVDSILFTDSSGSPVTSYSSGDSLYVTVRDQNRNMNGAVQETLTLPVTSTVAAGSDAEDLVLTETAPDSGIFRNSSALSVRSASVATGNSFLDLSGSGLGSVGYVDTGDASSTLVTLTYVAPPSGGGGGGGGGGGSGGGGGGGGGVGGIGYYIPSPTPVISTSTPAMPVPPVITPPVTSPLPPVVPGAPIPSVPPVAPSLDLSQRDALLAALGLTRDLAAEQRGLNGARADAREFHVTLTDAQANRLALFIAYGVSNETRRLGEGERRALIRDMLETMQTGDLSADDMQRLATGQIPLMRNRAVEVQQLPRVRSTFRTLYGHDPNFRNQEENLAWNTLMYRIRFTRNLTSEQQGIREFRSTFGRSPTTPFQWATVRVQGYVQR